MSANQTGMPFVPVAIAGDLYRRIRLRVVVTRRPKYAFKNEDIVIQAAALAHIIEDSIPTDRF